VQAESPSPHSDPSHAYAEPKKPDSHEEPAALGMNPIGVRVNALAMELAFIAEGLRADPPLVRPGECAEMLIGIAAELRSVAGC